MSAQSMNMVKAKRFLVQAGVPERIAEGWLAEAMNSRKVITRHHGAVTAKLSASQEGSLFFIELQ